MTHQTRTGRPRRAVGAVLIGALTTAAMTALPPAASAAPPPDVLTVDLAASTGPVLGGATGMLYGLSDVGVPAHDLIAGARPRTAVQKAPDGQQHPNGDAVVVADPFFAAGGDDVLVYGQDVYQQFPYEERGIADYLPRLRTQLEKIATRPDRARFVWVPFNEPDQIWYESWPAERQRFFDDWTATHRLIHEVIPEARIVGPNDARYRPERLREFLVFARDTGVLPDVMAWHELGAESLAGYRGRYADYRALEASLGLAPLPINIDEFANRRDTGVPGQMVQWLTMFEDTKVDAAVAYWTYAGNLDDHAVQTAQANGGWWLLKWYSDLTGDTVAVTPPRPSVTDTLQGMATLDRDRRQATVLLGGGSAPIAARVTGIDPTIFGDQVDVTVSRTAFTGQEGAAPAPQVLARQRQRPQDGTVTVEVPNDDRTAAYRVVVTPAAGPAPASPELPWSTSVEAENATLVDAQSYRQDTQEQSYAAYGGADVGSMNRPTSSVTFSVDVPAPGRYDLATLYGTNKVAGQHAVFVDGRAAAVTTYSPTLQWSYRGRARTTLDLTAGRHDISVRTAGADGVLLPGSDVTLDRFTLTADTGAETGAYPAAEARWSAGVEIVEDADRGRVARLGAGASATFYLSTADTGYHDLTTTFQGSATFRGSALDVALSTRTVDGGQLTAPAGRWSHGTLTAHLHAGITEMVLTNAGADPVSVEAVDLVRNTAADARTTVVEAETVALQGGVNGAPSVTTGRWASGGAYVRDIVPGATVTVPRPAATPPGQYDLTVDYANSARFVGHPYNTDVITRFLDVTEQGSGAAPARAPFRHNYGDEAFWSVTSPVALTTADGALVLGNPTEPGPNLDRIALSPLLVGRSVTTAG